MRTCSAHVRGGTALHTSRRGPAIIIRIYFDIYPCQDSAAEIELDLSRSVTRDHSRRGNRTVSSRGGSSSSGRRGWGPLPCLAFPSFPCTNLESDVKPAASAVPSTRPDSLSRFFHTCSRSGTRGAMLALTIIAARISFGFGAYTCTPRAAARIGRWPAPTCRRCGAVRSGTALPLADAAAAPDPPFYPVRRRRRRARGRGDGNDSDRSMLPAAGRARGC